MNFGRITRKGLGSSPVDSKKPSVLVYKVLEFPEKSINLIIMPFLSCWERPPLETVGETIVCIRQTSHVY
ncbi:hypothetical protein BDZ94DRAFT_652953 [Collybia nuda]|uniref:Uncharacterized protein n=1 Tax=Collybia nuda TaxID=64659 RepID=A0A9P5XRT8_9AGAR|nr:hypothetical protein BDZ94DRAFT_652953 [Collybia nuda]